MFSRLPLSYGHTLTDTVYYGQGNGDFTVTATMTDTLAGLNEVVFPDTTETGDSVGLNGVDVTSQPYTYNFIASDSFSDTVAVEVADRAGNVGSESFVVVNDTTSPTATITVPSVAGLRFAVSWAGSDSESGVRSYEVEFKEEGGAWTQWLPETTETMAYFRGEIDKSYRFQVRATDNVDNEGVWVESEVVEIATVTKYYTFGGQRVAMRRGAEVYFIHGDHLGSTSLTTDSAGAVVAESRYLPYGQERWSAGALPTDFTYTGQRSEGFNLLDYNARYYSPYLNRFISPDSIVPEPTSSSGFNRYRYTRNNPLKYIDPSGHLSEDQLQQLLGDDYDNLMELWKEYDPYFYDVITGDELQSGDFLEASFLEGSLLFQEVDGVMRVFAHGGASSTNLWDWQGQGAYSIKKPNFSNEQVGKKRDEMFDKYESVAWYFAPAFAYYRRGGSLNAKYLGARQVFQHLGDYQSSSWANVVFGEGGGATAFGQSVSVGTSAIGFSEKAAGLLGWSTKAMKVSSGVGLTLVAIDVALSINATYQAPREYTTNGRINPHIEQARLSRGG